MTQINIYLDEKEDKNIKLLMQKWKLPKYKTIKRIINEFKEVENES